MKAMNFLPRLKGDTLKKRIQAVLFALLAASSMPTAMADTCHIVTTWIGGVPHYTEIILQSGAVHQYNTQTLADLGCFN